MHSFIVWRKFGTGRDLPEMDFSQLVKHCELSTAVQQCQLSTATQRPSLTQQVSISTVCCQEQQRQRNLDCVSTALKSDLFHLCYYIRCDFESCRPHAITRYLLIIISLLHFSYSSSLRATTFFSCSVVSFHFYTEIHLSDVSMTVDCSRQHDCGL